MRATSQGRQQNKSPASCGHNQRDLFDHSVIRHVAAATSLCPSHAEKARHTMQVRELKGLQIAASSNIKQDGDTWIVPSQHSGKKYTVRLGPAPSCTCPDYETRRQPCKHIFAVTRILHPEPITELPEPVKRPTYKQEWPAYNQAQTNEKARLLEFLYELCQGIEDLPRNEDAPGRKRLSMGDMLFCAAFKIYSLFSGRRFITDLRDAQQRGYISRTPHFNSIFNYLELKEMTACLQQLIVESSLPLRSVETNFAVDSSGFTTGRFVRWMHAKYSDPTIIEKQDWVKVHLICGVKSNIVTAVEISDRYAGDSPFFKPLVEATAENFLMDSVSADKAYSSAANLKLVLSKSAQPYIPFKSNATPSERGGSVWKQMYHYYRLNQEWFMEHYHKRSNVESTFSMIKAKFGERIRSQTETAQINEVLCKVLCHNLCCLIQSIYELGIDVDFGTDRIQLVDQSALKGGTTHELL